MTLRQYRTSLGITLKEASLSTGVALRTYNRYEQDERYGSSLKRNAIINILKSKYEITEDKGVLTVDKIKETVSKIFIEYNEQIEFCYLFGSYSKGLAKDNSDVDLCISTSLEGLDFVDLIETLRENLHKKVDLIRLSDLNDNIELVNEIIKTEIRIYCQY